MGELILIIRGFFSKLLSLLVSWYKKPCIGKIVTAIVAPLKSQSDDNMEWIGWLYNISYLGLICLWCHTWVESQANYTFRLSICILVSRNCPLPRSAWPIYFITMNEWMVVRSRLWTHYCYYYTQFVTIGWPKKWFPIQPISLRYNWSEGKICLWCHTWVWDAGDVSFSLFIVMI